MCIEKSKNATGHKSNTDQPPSRGTIDTRALCEAGIRNDRERRKVKDIYLGSWGPQGPTASSSSSSISSSASSSSGASSSNSNNMNNNSSASSNGTGASSSGNSSSSYYRGTSIRVAIGRVFDVLKEQHMMEVSISSPSIDELLVQLQKAGSILGGEEQQVRMHLANLMDFAQAAVRSMAA